MEMYDLSRVHWLDRARLLALNKPIRIEGLSACLKKVTKVRV